MKFIYENILAGTAEAHEDHNWRAQAAERDAGFDLDRPVGLRQHRELVTDVEDRLRPVEVRAAGLKSSRR